MNPEATDQIYIVQDPGICGGKPRIKGTRIKVQHVAVEYEYMGWMPDKICDAHPHLTLAQVHAALAYYYDHKPQIDADMRADEDFISQLRHQISQRSA